MRNNALAPILAFALLSCAPQQARDAGEAAGAAVEASAQALMISQDAVNANCELMLEHASGEKAEVIRENCNRVSEWLRHGIKAVREADRVMSE